MCRILWDTHALRHVVAHFFVFEGGELVAFAAKAGAFAGVAAKAG